MTTTPIRKTTYCGVQAEISEVRAAGAHGRRVSITYWPTGSGPKNHNHPPKTATLRLVTGNFLKGTGRLMTREVLLDVTHAEAIEAAKALLASDLL